MASTGRRPWEVRISVSGAGWSAADDDGIQNIDDVLFELKKQDELTLQMKLETIWGETPPLLVTLMTQALFLALLNPFGFIQRSVHQEGQIHDPSGPFGKEKEWHPHQQPLELFRYLVRE